MIRYLILLLLVVAWESLASHSVGYVIKYHNNSGCTGTPNSTTALVGASELCFAIAYPSTINGTSPTITVTSMFNNCSLSGLFNYYNDSNCQTLVYQANSVCVVSQNDDYLTVCGPPSTTPTASPIRPK